MTDKLLPIMLAAALLTAGCRTTDNQITDPQSTRESLVAELPAAANSEPGADPGELLQAIEKAKKPRGPLDRRLSVSFAETPLDDVAQIISSLTGIGIVILSDNAQTNPLPKRNVSLTMQNARLGDILDWMMRQVQARYTLSGQGITISEKPEELYASELSEQIYVLRRAKIYRKPIYGTENPAAEKQAAFECVRTLLREYLQARPNSKLVLSHEKGEIVAVCSERAQNRIAQILREINRGTEVQPPAPDQRDAIRDKLETVLFCDYRNIPVTEILGALSIESGVNIGIDPADLADGVKTELTLNFGKASLGFILGTIINRCNLAGYELEPDRGIWLYKSKNYQETGRTLWESGVIDSYYVDPLVKRLSAKRLMQLIKENVTPGKWNSNLPKMTFTPTGRLIVFHSPQAQKQVASYLHVLKRAVNSNDLPRSTQ